MTGRHASRSMGKDAVPVPLAVLPFCGPPLKTGLQCQRLAALVRRMVGLTGWDSYVRWFPIRYPPSTSRQSALQFSHPAVWPGLTLSAHKRCSRPMTRLCALDDKKCAGLKTQKKKSVRITIALKWPGG